METLNRLTVARGEWEEWWEEGEGISQRTCMNDPWTWAMVWALTVEVGGVGWAEEGNGGKTGTTIIE